MDIQKKKVILDTDIGDDIDDSFALLLLLESNCFDVLGVTTVFRNTEKRAKMARQLIKVLGYDVNVYPGSNFPLISKIEDLIPPEIKAKEKVDEKGLYLIPQYDESMEKEDISSIHAVDFIIEQVHRYPHEVTIIPIGPMTNVALAIKKDPTIVPLIKEIRFMGGGYGLDWAEWNVFCDPEAAYIVYHSDIKISAVGFNVTCQTGLSPDDVNELKNSQSHSIRIIYKAMEKWFEHYKFTTPVMHDPLTVASLIDESIVTFIDEKMNVDLKNVRGKTFIDKENGSTIRVATEVNKDKFFSIFKEVLLKV